MNVSLRGFGREDLPAYAEALRSVYAEAFCAPPWNEAAEKAGEFARRLRDDVRRPGFTGVLAFTGEAGEAGEAGETRETGQTGETELVGFATAWTTGAPFPTDRCHPQAAAGLGPGRAHEWLVGSREVDELAVRPAAHGTGLAGDLLKAVTEDAPDGRAWLLTSVRSARAMAFYRRQGWAQATHPSPGGAGIAVFLGPAHPARALVPLPL
ncbi:GNAT family N-acetyltransferase [Streptomyces wuyuanensis]|uniref:GNAT family N-acetyltransferase n=1 Tax=Streptomyces wuyuanensis TaxID=1196353 RepID=UPI0034335629